MKTKTILIAITGSTAVLLLAGIALIGFGARYAILRAGGLPQALSAFAGHRPSSMDPRGPNTPLLEVIAIDESGARVGGAEVLLKPAEEEFWNGEWLSLPNGAGTFMSWSLHRMKPKHEGLFDVAVRAHGFAPAFESVSLPTNRPLTIRLDRGRPVAIRLRPPEGMALPPDAIPRVILEGKERIWAEIAMPVTQRSPVRVHAHAIDTFVPCSRGEGGEFIAHLPPTPASFRILLDVPGFLRDFMTEPMPIETEGPIEVQLPQPARLDVTLTADPEAIETTNVRALAMDLMSQTRHSQIGSLWVEPAGDFSFTEFFAPGAYRLRGTTAGTSRQATRNLARFRGETTVELAAGDSRALVFHYELIDATDLTGNGRAELMLLKLDGSPAAGRKWSVTYSAGDIREFPIANGTVPDDGRVVLERLRDEDRDGHYQIAIDESDVGSFRFKDANPVVEATFRMAPGVGDPAPAMTLRRMSDGATIDTSSFAGKVVYLDFWATWCGPCQRPLAHLNEIARRRAAEWSDDVVLAAISIDDDIETLAEHVRKNQWTAPLHLWADGAWQSQGARDYGIQGVPTAFLVDRTGVIRWRGHPGDSSFDLEEEIERAR